MNISAWVQELDKAKDVHAQWAQTDALLARGARDTLVQIALACADNGPQQWARRSIFDRIVAALALESDARNVAALAQIYAQWPENTREPKSRHSKSNLARQFASMLAQEQATQDLLDLTSWAAQDEARRELVACCIGELVVRGRPLKLDGATKSLLRSHPLAALPPELLDCERDFPALLPHYAGRAWSRNFAPVKPLSKIGEGQKRQLTPLSFDEAQLQSAVLNWELESNGNLEAGIFQLATPLEVAGFGTCILRDSGLDCTREIQSAQRVSLSSVTNALFSAASGGGAYNSGEYGAWGRWQCWRSVAALVGTDATDVAAIAERAHACAWFDFALQGAWFYAVAWDIGLACLRADGQSLAILAATDTD